MFMAGLGNILDSKTLMSFNSSEIYLPAYQ